MAGIVKSGFSAIMKLILVIALAGAFVVGLLGVVSLSLHGAEVTVPEIVGKNFNESEREMADLGLKLKRRATRYSQETPNTILEQLPKAGDTVKTGQTILVVLSEANPEGNEAPATIQKDGNAAESQSAQDENTDITPDKPAKTNKNANVKKPAQTTRDVISVKSNKNSNTETSGNTSTGNSSSTNTKSGSNDNKNSGNKNGVTPAGNKSVTPANSNRTEPAKPNQSKPSAAKTPVTNGDTRTRRVTQP